MKLEILCGSIASGKSTYCNEAAKEGAIIVNDDAIVTAIHGGNYELYDKSLKPLYKSVENLIVQTGLIMGRRVIVDRPNYARHTRQRYISLAKALDASVYIVMMAHESPEIHALRRVKHDGRGRDYEYWLKVALRHQKLYEPPSNIEGFDEIVHWNPNLS